MGCRKEDKKKGRALVGAPLDVRESAAAAGGWTQIASGAQALAFEGWRTIGPR